VSLADAARESFVAYRRKDYPDYHELLAAVFAKPSGQPRIAEEHDGASSLVSAIAAGNGVALVPQALACFAGPGLKLIPLAPSLPSLIIGATWHPDGLTAAAEQFLRCARDASAKVASPPR